MKKLMIALTAVATAFGLYAADSGFIAGSSFEETAPVQDRNYTWDGTSKFVSGYWANEAAASIVAAGQESYMGTRPEEFATKGNGSALKIATTLGTPVKEFVMGDMGVSPKKIGDGLYFDGLVNFTVFDKDDTPATAEAKLAVYLQLEGADESDGTNLFVRAAGLNGTTNDYRCTVGSSVKVAPGWHRLTIKMIDSICTDSDLVGFVVYVDGEAVSNMEAKPQDTMNLKPAARIFNDAGELFASLEGGADEISYVAFDGQGVVDDIAFTTTAPTFAADPQAATVRWNPTKIAAVSATGEDDTWIETQPVNFNLENLTGGKVYYKAKDGFVDGSITVEDGDDETIDDEVDAAAAAVNGKAYAEFEDADAALYDAPVNSTLKLFEKMAEKGLEISTDKAFILDLNNQTIASVEAGAASAVTIKGPGAVLGALDITGELTITDGAEFFDFTAGYAAIATPADLNKLALVVNAGYDTTGRTFKQTVDIDMTSAGTFPGIGVYNNGLGSAAAFKGVYDGNNQTISNVTIAPAKYQGLFAQVEGGTVKNLTVDQVTFGWVANYATKVQGAENKKECVFVEEVGGAMCVGCLVDGTVENVTTKGSFGSADAPLTASAGGVVNRICAVNAAVNITSCTNEAAMYTAGAKSAGIAIINQKADKTVTISDCVNKGAINFVDKELRTVDKTTAETTDKCDTAGGYAGVIAHTIAITINNCSNEGAITVAEKAITDGACIGQIVGHTRGSVTATGCSGLTATLAYGNDTDNYKAAGLDFATVDNGVATYVATPTLGGEYLVTSALAAYEFIAAGTITFDDSLVPGFKPTTDTEKFSLTNEGNVWTCTVKPTTFKVTVNAAEAGSTITSLVIDSVTKTPASGEFDVTEELSVTYTLQAGYAWKDGTQEDARTFNATAAGTISAPATEAIVYTVTVVTENKNCSATVTPESGVAGATVAIVLTPDTNYEFAEESYEGWKKESDGTLTQTYTIVVGENEIEAPVATEKAAPTPAPLDPDRKDEYLAWANGKEDQLALLTDDQKIEAFLLDCEPTTSAIEDAKKAFKIASITQDAEGKWVVTVVDEKTTEKGEMYKNGYVEIVEYTDITVTSGKLYKAVLRQTPVKVGE